MLSVCPGRRCAVGGQRGAIDGALSSPSTLRQEGFFWEVILFYRFISYFFVIQPRLAFSMPSSSCVPHILHVQSRHGCWQLGVQGGAQGLRCSHLRRGSSLWDSCICTSPPPPPSGAGDPLSEWVPHMTLFMQRSQSSAAAYSTTLGGCWFEPL